jgi:uncharacterized protein YpmS
MKIYSNDGVEFKTTDECKAYEAKLVLQKAKEESEKKAKQEKGEELYAQIKDTLNTLDDLIKSYKEQTGRSIRIYQLKSKDDEIRQWIRANSRYGIF